MTHLYQTIMSFLIIIGIYSLGRLFPPSVHSGGSRGRHILSPWGSWGYPLSWGYWGSWASQRYQISQRYQRSQWSQRYWASPRSWGSRGYPAYPASPAALADFASREFCAPLSSRQSCRYVGSWGCGGYWAPWASWERLMALPHSSRSKKVSKKSKLFCHVLDLMQGLQKGDGPRKGMDFYQTSKTGMRKHVSC